MLRRWSHLQQRDCLMRKALSVSIASVLASGTKCPSLQQISAQAEDNSQFSRFPFCQKNSHVGAYRFYSTTSTLLQLSEKEGGQKNDDGEKKVSNKEAAVIDISATTFETDVIQSTQAVCLVFYIPTPHCQSYIELVKKIAGEEVNQSGVHWVRIALCNADKNPNLAAALSVPRAKLPATLFIYSGTMVDRVSGSVPEERLRPILHKYKVYYQEQTGQDLGGPGSDSPMAMAKAVKLTDAPSAEVVQRQMVEALTGLNKLHLVVPDTTTGQEAFVRQILANMSESITLYGSKERKDESSFSASVTPMEFSKEVYQCIDSDQKEKISEMEQTLTLLRRGRQLAEKEVWELKNRVGFYTKRLSGEQLATEIFSNSVYSIASSLAMLEALFYARLLVSCSTQVKSGTSHYQNLKKYTLKFIQSVQEDYNQGLLSHSSSKKVNSLTEILMASVHFVEEVSIKKKDDPNVQLHFVMQQWMKVFDQSLSEMSLLSTQKTTAKVPIATLEQVYIYLKKLFLEMKKARGDDIPACQERFQVTKKFFVAALSLYPIDAEISALRARLASLLY